jgi:hypothetical protein
MNHSMAIVQETNVVLDFMENWEYLRNTSEQGLWNRLHSVFLADDASGPAAADDKKLVKKLRREHRKELTIQAIVKDGEMCAD